MPELNHTGPLGNGPRTGRGLGKCKSTKSDSGNNSSDEDNLSPTAGKSGQRLRLRIQRNGNRQGRNQGFRRNQGNN